MNICKCCGRTLNTGFMFCPWCGESKLNNDENGLDGLFAKLEAKQKIDRENRLEEMKSRLEDLEKELSVLALSYEMSR